MRKRINIGDCYRDCTAVWNVWEVQRIYMDLLGVPHAIIRNTADVKDRRTIACPTLLERRRFELVTEEIGGPEAARLNAGRRATGGGFAHPHH
ncbi:MAG TPA: hypothetical protein VGA60_15080 [Kiloniellales bacterium]|jgi:hypothetical protein